MRVETYKMGLLCGLVAGLMLVLVGCDTEEHEHEAGCDCGEPWDYGDSTNNAYPDDPYGEPGWTSTNNAHPDAPDGEPGWTSTNSAHPDGTSGGGSGWTSTNNATSTPDYGGDCSEVAPHNANGELCVTTTDTHNTTTTDCFPVSADQCRIGWSASGNPFPICDGADHAGPGVACSVFTDWWANDIELCEHQGPDDRVAHICYTYPTPCGATTACHSAQEHCRLVYAPDGFAELVCRGPARHDADAETCITLEDAQGGSSTTCHQDDAPAPDDSGCTTTPNDDGELVTQCGPDGEPDAPDDAPMECVTYTSGDCMITECYDGECVWRWDDQGNEEVDCAP